MQRRVAALLLWLLAAAVQAAVQQQEEQRGQPVVFLHLSDIHFSTNTRGKYWRAFGDREGDAALWSASVVPRLGAQAVLITGDLTDSKTARGDGLQQEAEWRAYATLLANLSAAGLPPQRVWDLPGNHDTFNLPLRAGANDFFSQLAAEGRRRASPQQRAYIHCLPLDPAGGDGGGGSGGAGGVAADGSSACPAAWFLGLDPTPEPGLRSPTNFAGQARPAMLAETAAALRRIHERQPAACGPPLIIAYSHYPPSCIDSTPTHGGLPGILLHAAEPALAMQGLTQLLAEHNVSAVLSGHLHSSFGERLHRLHATPSGGRMADLETAAWKDDRRFRLLALDGGALSFAELFFHSAGAPRMPARPDAAAAADPAWRQAYGERGWAVTSLDPAAAVVDHIALITSPPDGRYSPLGAPAAPWWRQQQGRQQQEGEQQQQEGDQQQEEGLVRALVFSLDAEGGSQGLDVQLAGFLPGGGAQLFSKPMQLQPGAAGGSGNGGGGGSGGGGLLYSVQAETTVSCVGAAGGPAAGCHPPAEHLLIQVVVKGPNGRVSRSARQPAALRCAALTASHQRCWVAPVEAPLPLGSTLLEWLGMAFNWPVMVHRLFLGVWALWVGALLVAPRLLAPRVAPLIAASPLLQCRPPGQEQPPSTPKGAAGGPAAAAAAAVRTALAWLLWPMAALFVCATVTEVWAALLGFSLYVLLGPWLLYDVLTGYPPAAMFSFGVLGRLPLGGGGPDAAATAWRFVPTCDTMFATLVHTVVVFVPATLWVACVVARRCQLQPHAYSRAPSRSASSESSGSEGVRRRMEGGGSSAASLLGAGRGVAPAACCRWSFSAAQLAAFAALAAFACAAMYLKAAALMGGIAVALSPGFAWTLPLTVLLVVAWGGPRRPYGHTGKGE